MIGPCGPKTIYPPHLSIAATVRWETSQQQLTLFFLSCSPMDEVRVCVEKTQLYHLRVRRRVWRGCVCSAGERLQFRDGDHQCTAAAARRRAPAASGSVGRPGTCWPRRLGRAPRRQRLRHGHWTDDDWLTDWRSFVAAAAYLSHVLSSVSTQTSLLLCFTAYLSC